MSITVKSLEELEAALAGAKGGETILLEGGDYGRFSMSKWISPQIEFASTVTLTSADPDNPAVFSNVTLNGVTNMVMDGVVFDYTYTLGDKYNDRPFEVNGSSNVTIRNSEFSGDLAHGLGDIQDGVGFGFGLSVRKSENITIENNLVHDFQRGIIFNGVSGLVVRDNELTAMSGDGMNFAAVQDVLIEDNLLHNFIRNETAAIHPDMIQFWTSGTNTPSTDVIIRGNTLDIGDGVHTQSIFMRNERVDSGQDGYEMYYRNILIEDNMIVNAHLHGITVGETDGLTIRNNSVLHRDGNSVDDADSSVEIPTIRVRPDSKNVTIIQNATSDINGYENQADWTLKDNAFVQDQNPTGVNYYGDIFVGSSLITLDGLHGMQALPGSILDRLDAGSSATLSPVDISRPAFNITVADDNPAVRIFDASALAASDSLPEGAVFTWTFDDGTKLTGAQVRHHFAEAGSHGVTLSIDTGVRSEAGSVSRSLKIDIAGPRVLEQADAGFHAFDERGNAIFISDPAVQNGAIKLGASGSLTSVGSQHVQDISRASTFSFDFNLKADGPYEGGEILRIHQALILNANAEGGLNLLVYDKGGDTKRLQVSDIGLDDLKAHDIQIHYTGKKIEIGVDGSTVGSMDMQNGIYESSKPLTFGDPWGKSNFSGTLKDLNIAVNKEFYASVDAFVPPVVEEPVVVLPDPDPVEAPKVEDEAPEPVPAPPSDIQDPVLQPTDSPIEGLIMRSLDIGDGNFLELGDPGVANVVDRDIVSDLLRADNFEITFDLRAVGDELGGEIFRLHRSIIIRSSDTGDLVVQAFGQDGERTTLRSESGFLADHDMHEVTIRLVDGQLQILADGELQAFTAFEGRLQDAGGHDLTFGNPWDSTNFDGEIGDFSFGTDSVSASDAGYDSVGLIISGQGVAGQLDRGSVSEIFDTEGFGISFSLEAGDASSAGEVFRLHGSIVTSVNTDGNMMVKVWSEDGSVTTLKTQGVNFGDMKPHDVALTYMNGTLSAVVDGAANTAVEIPAPIQSMGSHDLTFGNPWGKQNFEGSLGDFSIDVAAAAIWEDPVAETDAIVEPTAELMSQINDDTLLDLEVDALHIHDQDVSDIVII